MKKLGKLRLNQLSKDALENREMNYLKGGVACSCGCLYSGDQCSSGDDYWGGSSTQANGAANKRAGSGPCGCICVGGGTNTNASDTSAE